MSETLAEKVNKLKNETALAENRLSDLMDRIKETRDEKERAVSDREDLQRKIANRKMDLERKTKALKAVDDKLRSTTSKKDTMANHVDNGNGGHGDDVTYDDFFETLRELRQNKTTEECKNQELSNKLKNNRAKMDTIKNRIAKNNGLVAKDQARLSDLQNQNSGLDNHDQPDEDELLSRLKDTEELILQHCVRKENADRRLRNLKGQIDKIGSMLSLRNKEIADIEREINGFNSLI